MRVTVVRDGETSSAEVAEDLATVTVGGRAYPVRVVAQTASRIEFEIAGERVTVDGWLDRYAAPLGPIDVNGERWTVRIEAEAAKPAAGGRATALPTTPARAAPAAPAVTTGKGTPILPPMPGKIVDLRVREGEKVHRGQVLLVLEAMKMRNEIASPADGTVRGLAVAAGANVRAHDPMLYVEPD